METTAWFDKQANREKLRSAVVKVARAQVGYTEGPGNDTKYGRDLRYNGTAWCGVFVSWVYDRACTSLLVPNPLTRLQTSFGFAHVTSAYATAAARRMALNSAWLITEQAAGRPPLLPGDVICWDHDDMPGGPGHTGIVVRTYKDGSFDTIEGNTNQAMSRTGGQVGRHDHHALADRKHGRCLGVIRPTRRYAMP